jgi:hypothetical protein
MDFQYCPNCQAFNPAGVTHCEQCKTELPPEEPTPPPAAPAVELAAPAAEPAGIPDAGTAEPPAIPAPIATTPQQAPVPFAAPPEVLDRVRHLEAEIEKKPSANALYLQLSQLYLDQQRKDLAIRTLERCLEHDPKNAYLRHRLEQIGGPPAARPLPGAAGTALRPPAAAAPKAASLTPPTARVAMPLRPVYRRPVRRRGVSRPVILGGVAGALLLALVVKLLFFPGPKLVVGGAFSAVAPKWSPTGRHFAFVKSAADQTRLGVYDLGKGAYRELGDLAGWDASAFAWSPDGKRIAYVGHAARDWDEAVFVIDIEHGLPRRVAAGRMPSWAPDGTTLLMWCSGNRGLEQAAEPVVSADGEVVDSGEVAYRAPEPPGLCRVNAETGDVIRRAPDSEDFSFGWGSDVSAVLGKVVFEKASDEQPAPPPAKSLDGEFVEMVDAMAARGARNVAEGSRDVSRELEARARDQKRNPDKTSGYARDVYVSDFDGGPARPVTNDGHSGSPVWTPDGEHILFADDGGLWLMNADGSGRQRAYQGKLGHPPAPQLTADGRYVLFVAPVEANAGVAQMMTGESPEDLHVARVGGSSAKRLENRHPFKQRFALSPDGSRIVYEVLADPGTLTRRGGRSELWLMRR